MLRPLLAFFSALAFIAAPVMCGAAEDYPGRPIRFLVPFPAGGGTDGMARILGTKLTEMWGQQVIIDNRAGAQGNIGTAAGAKAVADGYTITLAHSGSLAINPHLYSAPGFDTLKDFAAVSNGVLMPFILVVHPSVPVKTTKDLVQLAKQRPGALVYGTPGIATGTHLASEFFAIGAGIKLTHVPYKGGAPAMVDLAAGNTTLMFSTFSTGGQHLTSGRLRALAVAAPARNRDYPAVPTMRESGYGALDASAWNGLVARAGVPRAIITRLNAEIARAVELPEVRNAFASAGLDLAVGSAEDFDQFIRSEYVKWEKVARVAKITTD